MDGLRFYDVGGGRVCLRRTCGRAKKCAYPHYPPGMCKSKTPEEARAFAAEVEARRIAREEMEWNREREDRIRRDRRDEKIALMLEAHGLTLEDLEEWAIEVVGRLVGRRRS